MALIRHRQEPGEAVSLFDWAWPAQGWWSRFDGLFRDGEGRQMLRVEEFDQDGTMVVRAEMPGIDPDKDVEISVADGTLSIRAERSEEEETSKGQPQVRPRVVE
jgi:HSP20 family molecular chaperone IbpA